MQHLHQGPLLALGRPLGDEPVKVILVGLSIQQRGEGVAVEGATLRLDDGDQGLPFFFRPAGQGQPAVFARAGVNTVGRSPRVAVALSFLLSSVGGVVEQERGEEVHGGLQLGQVQVVPLAGATAVVQRGQDRGHGEARDNEVGIGAVGVDRRAVGPAGDVGQPHKRREDGAEAGLPLHRPAPTHHGGAEHNQSGVDCLQFLEAQPPVLHGAGGEVLGHYVRPSRQPQHQLAGAGVSHIHGDAHLICVVAGEVGAAVDAGHAVAKGSRRAQSTGALGRLNPHHRRSMLAEVLGGHRPPRQPNRSQGR